MFSFAYKQIDGLSRALTGLIAFMFGAATFYLPHPGFCGHANPNLHVPLIAPYVVAGQAEAAESLDDQLSSITKRLDKQSDPADLCARARVFVLKNDWSSAIHDLDKALLADPDSIDALQLRAYAFYRKEDADRCRADCLRCTVLEPKQSRLWFALAMAWEKLRQWEACERAIQNSIALDPSQSQSYAYKAAVFLEQNKYDAAQAAIAEGLAKFPDSTLLLCARASVRDQKGGHAEAMRELENIVAAHPNCLMALMLHVQIAESLNDWVAALKDYDRILSINPASSEPALNLYDYFRQFFETTDRQKMLVKRIQVCEKLRDFEGAYKGAVALSLQVPKSADPYFYLAHSSYILGRFDEAKNAIDKYMELEPMEVEDMYYLRACNELARNEPRLSLSDFTYVTEHWNPSDYDSPNDAVYCSFVYRALLEKVLKRNPENVMIAAAAKLNPEKWPDQMLVYLQGKISQEALFTAADDNHKLTELHCFLGLRALGDGDRVQMKQEFEWVCEHGDKSSREYPLCRALLKRL